MPYTVQPLQPQDAEAFTQYLEGLSFSHAPHWAGCYCRFYHCADEAWTQRTAEQNRAEAVDAIRAGNMRGYLAYDGARVIGWCNANDVRAYTRLASELAPIVGEERIGLVICFVIDPAYRNQGVARLLLKAAVEGFRTQGYATVLALPAETDLPEKRYRGTLHMYEEQGFVRREYGGVSLMRLDLMPDSSVQNA